MHPRSNPEQVAKTLLEDTGLDLISCTPIQTLWAGYGQICALRAKPTGSKEDKPLSLILKYVSPPVKSGQRVDEGHLRKVISYQVEQHFYTQLASKLPENVAVASCLASIDAHDSSGNITAMVLTDLRQLFPIAGEKRAELSQRQVHAAIDWLAGFHGFWWSRCHEFHRNQLRLSPLKEKRRTSNGNADVAGTTRGVWLNGGYTYLATRRSEYASLREDTASEWTERLCSPSVAGGESVAERVAGFLAPAVDGSSAISPYETLIHGDVKSENLFTTSDGDAVAFFDFQYVGLGLGVCDLAKLFTCSVPERMLFDQEPTGCMHPYEEVLLRRYLSKLEEVSGNCYDWPIFLRHWEVALVDWLRFQASWGFWGNTEWLEARVKHILVSHTFLSWLNSSD